MSMRALGMICITHYAHSSVVMLSSYSCSDMPKHYTGISDRKTHSQFNKAQVLISNLCPN